MANPRVKAMRAIKRRRQIEWILDTGMVYKRRSFRTLRFDGGYYNKAQSFYDGAGGGGGQCFFKEVENIG